MNLLSLLELILHECCVRKMHGQYEASFMADDHFNWDEDISPQPAAGRGADEGLVIDVDGFEGPLDLLLALARSQKVDLAKISILTLVEQYLAFIDRVRDMRLELAADYLVMAAWLAYLKSKLLLPEPEDEGAESGEELAQILAFRLKRLQAMREASASLMNSNRLGRDVFARGAPEHIEVIKKSTFSATLYDLLTAYANQRQRQSVSVVQISKRAVWSLQDAREALERLIGERKEWARLDDYLMEYLVKPEDRASVLASSFTASLELVRNGSVQMRQSEAFAPLYLRAAEQTSKSQEGA